MDRAALEQLLREAEVRLYREEQEIARQHEVIAALKERGDDASQAKLCLRRLESQRAQRWDTGLGRGFHQADLWVPFLKRLSDRFSYTVENNCLCCNAADLGHDGLQASL